MGYRGWVFAWVFVSAAAWAGDCKREPFGLATPFNLYVLNSLTHHDTDTQGRVAVGGDCRLHDYRVGEKAAYSNLNPYVLVVGQTLTARNGEAEGGAVAYGSRLNLARTFRLDRRAVQRVALPFLDIARDLAGLSARWAKLPGIAAVETDAHTLTLKGADKSYNVFTVTAAQLKAATYLRFQVPAESSVLVNVTGEKVQMVKYGFEMNGCERSRVVFHFPQARTLDLGELALPGSVLAPAADLIFEEAKIFGQLITYNLNGNGQVNWVPFAGCLP